MAFGFGVLRLSSQQFWSLSVIEATHAWRAIYGQLDHAPTRAVIADMMKKFPDHDRSADGH